MVAKKGSFTCPASTGNSSVTGVGFQPDAVIFFLTSQTATGYSTSADLGGGFMTSASQGSWYIGDKNSQSSSPNQLTVNTDNASCLTTANTISTSLLVKAAKVSLNADGFTVNFTTVSSGVIIHYLAIQGVTNAKAATSLNFSSGNQSITGVGFQPDAVLLVAAHSDAAISLGAATSATSRAAAGWTAAYPTPTLKANQIQVSNKVFSVAYDDADLDSADLVSMDSDGFTLSHSAAGAVNYVYLALKGGTIALGTDTQKTSTGTKSKTGTGASPAGLMFISANAASTSTLQTTGTVRLSLGAADATTGGATWIDERGDGTSLTASDQRTTTSAALGMSTGTATTNAEAVISSMDADGYTLNWTTADATAREFIYISFAGNPPNPIGKGFGAIEPSQLVGQAVQRAANW